MSLKNTILLGLVFASMYSHAAATVEPSCKIGDTVWGACQHDDQGVLANGAKLRVLSNVGVGYVDYKCDNGALKTDQVVCKKPNELTSTASEQTIASTQNTSAVTSTKSVTLNRTKRYTAGVDTTSSSFNTSMQQLTQNECGRITGNIPGTSTYSVVGKTTSSVDGSDLVSVELQCQVQVSLRCDQTFRDMHGPGDYDSTTGEMSATPGYNALLKRYCNGQSAYSNDAPSPYTELSSVLFLDYDKPARSPWDVDTLEVDNFHAVLICGGNTSQCSASGNTGSPTMTSVLSCSSAEVTHPAITRVTDSGRIAPSNGEYVCDHYGTGNQQCVEASSVLTYACKPLGFTSLISFTVASVLGNTAEVNAVCGGYQGTTPLKSECSVDQMTFGPSAISPKDCNSAVVMGELPGDEEPVQKTLTLMPSDASVQTKMCDAAGYSTLTKVNSRTLSGSGATYNIYAINAECTDKKVVDPSCKNDAPCRGATVPSTDPRPKFCDATGCVLNTCATTTPPDNLCKDCEPATLSFTDQSTGLTCAVSSGTLTSGVSTTIPFLNASNNGEATIKCNNGAATVVGGSCYRSCPGGVSLGWADSGGALSCNQMVPAGNYAHGQTVSLGSSVSNTGSASAICNNGSWEIQSGAQCSLDCTGSASWGSGTSLGGADKTNACSVPSVILKHNQSATVSSSAAGTSGTATLSCNNGVINASGATCDVGCPAENVSWSGGICQASLSSSTHGVGQTVNASANPGYAYAWSVSGVATYQCADGKNSVASSACKYVVNETATPWSSWADTGPLKNCSAWTPDASTQPGGTAFEQTKTCDQEQVRTRTVSYVWNDGSTTLKANESETQTIQKTQTQMELGIGPQADPVCRYDANNFVNYTTYTETIADPYRDGDYYYELREVAEFTWDGVLENVVTSNWNLWTGMHDPDTYTAQNGDYIWAGVQKTAGLYSEFEICRQGNAGDSIVTVSYGDWSAWYDIGLQYNCSAWTPDASTIAAGQSFTATQSCSQKQERQRDVYNVWSSGKKTFKELEKGYQEIAVSNSEQRVGTKVATVLNTSTLCGAYVEHGTPYDCGAWSPDPSTVSVGVEYDATRQCSMDETRACTVYNHWDDGSTTIDHSYPETRTKSVTNPGRPTGTKNDKLETVSAGCYVDTLAFDYYENGSCAAAGYRFEGQEAKAIFSVGNVLSAGGDYMYFDFPAVVTWSGCTDTGLGWCYVSRSCINASNCPALPTTSVTVTVTYLGQTRTYTITAADHTRTDNGTPEP